MRCDLGVGRVSVMLPMRNSLKLLVAVLYFRACFAVLSRRCALAGWPSGGGSGRAGSIPDSSWITSSRALPSLSSPFHSVDSLRVGLVRLDLPSAAGPTGSGQPAA
jgi:hypothetical protein